MEITLEITALSRSGAGLGRDPQGRVIFVPFSAPGDQVRVEILEEEKRFAEARILEILRPSKQRQVPPCPVYGKCGGCEWQHIPYALQWETKKSGVLHALARVQVESAGIPWRDFPAEQIWEYRNRIQLRGFQKQIGFFARRSRDIVPIEKCWIARSELNACLPAAREKGAALPRMYKLELEVFPGGEIQENWNSRHAASGFRQVHDAQNAKLQSWVAEELGSGGILLDLYGGSGNLSWDLQERFGEIYCVDMGAPGENRPGQAPHYFFVRAGVADWLRQTKAFLAKKTEPIHAVLDPPREGLGAEWMTVIETLKELPVQEILLIGCDPDPWARAVSRFIRHGWKVKSLGALDFFPQTHHVEALACLHRS